MASRFRWAALQIQGLRRLRIVRPYDVLSILDALPPDLDATYDRILARLDQRFRHEAFTALEWLAFARRPVFIEELAEASIIDPKSKVIVDPDRRIDPSDVAELLSGLVVVEPEIGEESVFPPRTHVISLAHFSVQEYLVSRNRQTPTAEYWFLEATVAHSNIVMSCIAYLRYCYTAFRSNLSQPRLLQSYCLNRWAQHAALITEGENEDVWNTIFEMLSDREVSGYWIQHGRVFWTEELLACKESRIESSPFSRSPYADAPISQVPELLRYYSLYHCVVHGLHKLVQALLGRSGPPLSLRPYGSVLEAAVVSEDLTMVKILLRHGADFGKSLSLALHRTNEEIAAELISHGCEVQADELRLAARRSSPEIIRRIVRSRARFHLGDAVLALDASLIGQKGATETLLGILLSENPLAFEKPCGNTTVYEGLLIKACEIGLPYTVDLLTRLEGFSKTFICNYNKAFHPAVSCRHTAVIKSLLNSRAKSGITYKSFSRAIRRTIRKRDYVVFQPLLWHIPAGSNVASSMSRAAIASDNEKLALRLLADGAGFDENGVWVDDIFLLAAVLLQSKTVVRRLMLFPAHFWICEALADERIVQDVCEILYIYGAKLAIHRLNIGRIHSPGIDALARAHIMTLSRFNESQNATKWSLKRIMEIQVQTFLVTGSNSWCYGSDSIQDLASAAFVKTSPFPTGSSWQNPTFITIHRYTSPSSGRTWVIFKDMPTTPWIGRVYDVELLNQDEVAWEVALDALPYCRESAIIQDINSDQEPRGLTFPVSHASSTILSSTWGETIRYMLKVWGELVAQGRTELVRSKLIAWDELMAQGWAEMLPVKMAILDTGVYLAGPPQTLFRIMHDTIDHVYATLFSSRLLLSQTSDPRHLYLEENEQEGERTIIEL